MNADRRQTTPREAAAAWHNRMQQDDPCGRSHKAFLSWLKESPENQAAYDEVERSWNTLRANAQDPDILALRHEAALRLTRRNSRERVSWSRAGMAAAAILAAATLILVSHSDQRHTLLANLQTLQTGRAYTTGIGQQLAVVLSDNSHITLDTQSEMRVTFTGRTRNVQLVRGQALFDVAKDVNRPFAVSAGHRRFVALGTIFDVHVTQQQVKVTMVEGAVRVDYDAAPPQRTAADQDSHSPPEMTLTAGEQLVTDEHRHDRVYTVNPKQVTSWLHGQVIFDNTSLAAAAAELNRYSAVQIKLEDPKLADIRFSGAFTTDRPDLFVEAITAYYPIVVIKENDRVLLLKPR